MRVIFGPDGSTTELDIVGVDATTTVDEIAAALGLTGGVAVDGTTVDGDVIAQDVIHDGAHIRSPGRPTSEPRPCVEVHAETGPFAGHVWRLASGTHRFGGDDGIGWTGAPEMACLVSADGTVTINGEGDPWDLVIGDRFEIGGHHFLAAPTAPTGPPGPIVYNRPPRTIEPRHTAALRPPTRSKVTGKARPRSVLGMILPVVMGVGLAVLLNRLMFLAFALMSPVMALGHGWDDKRRRRKEAAANEAQFAEDLATFACEVAAHHAVVEAQHTTRHPFPATLLTNTHAGHTGVWERRPHHDDFMHLVLGVGDLPWRPELLGGPGHEPEVDALFADRGRLRGVPVDHRLDAGSVLGLTGRRDTTRHLAASLVCQAIALHGPADLRVAILTDRPLEWDWAKWIPNVRANDGEVRLLAVTDEEHGAILGFLRAASDDGASSQLTLLISDVENVAADLRRVHREVVGGAGLPVAAIVLRDRASDLPAACTAIVHLDGVEAVRVIPGDGDAATHLVPATVTRPAAHELARRLARFEDPEAASVAGSLPDVVPLLDLLGLPRPTAGDILDRWRRSGPIPRIAAPIGAIQGGAFEIDIVQDGPHGLLAGTTGSGKSELLRSLVASLAASVDPDHLNFVLIDYKGGSAFDVCADLPHVVGLVTDLDQHLGERALICLEAELHHREEQLRAVGAADLTEYLKAGHPTPLPRLLVVVDEFAALASELPDFMDALVDIAARGRSLGVHMVLATQRPSGVIKESIRANTNLRMSLRVQTAADSMDVLADKIAARLPRSRPGRGYARLGPSELVPFQSALATAPRAATSRCQLRVTPFVWGMRQPRAQVPSVAADGPTDLELLVEAIVDANTQAGYRSPRKPWPEPLPLCVAPSAIDGPTCNLEIPLGIVDEPTLQRQRTFAWDPATTGNLLLMGMPGAGASESLVTIATQAARHHDPDELHVYAIDHGPGLLGVIAELPHCGAVIGAEEIERQERLLRHLLTEIGHRKRSSGSTPSIILLVDGMGGFKATFDEAENMRYRDILGQIVAEGPAQRIYTVISGDQNRNVPGTIMGVIRERLVFQVGDRMDLGMLGLQSRHVPDLPPMRAIDVVTTRHVHVATTTPDQVREVAAASLRPSNPPAGVDVLEPLAKLGDIIHTGDATPSRLRIPVGIGYTDLSAVFMDLDDGDHALIVGGARSGKSTALAAAATAVAHIDESTRIVGVALRRSPLRDTPAVAELITTADQFADLIATIDERRTLLLIDDADEVEDPGGLEQMIAGRHPGLHVVAAGRPDAMRGAFRHWTKALRASRRGMILKPIDTGDGEPLGARLPRRIPDMPTGRGYLCDGGDLEVVQAALP